jgi:hypothetical protein
MDSYLDLAARVLRELRRPLDARQILKTAYQMSIVPKDLYGKTQHKTLHARLAEDIRRGRMRSAFIRTDPGRFFLRAFLNDASIPVRYKREYPAPPRADQLRNFDILCFRRSDAQTISTGQLIDASILDASPMLTRRLSEVHGVEGYMFLRTFVIMLRSGSFVLRRSAFGLQDTIEAKSSLGSIGFVKARDKTMFSEDVYGIAEASLRTLSEQLELEPNDVNFIHSRRLITLMGLIVAPSQTGENSLLAVTICRCPETFDPIARYLDHGAVYWHPIESKINDWSSLDPWSRELLVSGAFEKIVLKGAS